MSVARHENVIRASCSIHGLLVCSSFSDASAVREESIIGGSARSFEVDVRVEEVRISPALNARTRKIGFVMSLVLGEINGNGEMPVHNFL